MKKFTLLFTFILFVSHSWAQLSPALTSPISPTWVVTDAGGSAVTVVHESANSQSGNALLIENTALSSTDVQGYVAAATTGYTANTVYRYSFDVKFASSPIAPSSTARDLHFYIKQSNNTRISAQRHITEFDAPEANGWTTIKGAFTSSWMGNRTLQKVYFQVGSQMQRVYIDNLVITEEPNFSFWVGGATFPEAAGWNTGVVPDPVDGIVVQVASVSSGVAVIGTVPADTDITFGNLIIHNSRIDLSAGAKVTVTNQATNQTNNNSLSKVKSTATAQAQFLTNSNFELIVENARPIATGAPEANWYPFSSGFHVAASANVTGTVNLLKFSESANDYANESSTLASTEGYLLYPTTATNFNFNGEISNLPLRITNLSADGQGFHLLPNPYSAGITVNKFLPATGFEQAVWVYNPLKLNGASESDPGFELLTGTDVIGAFSSFFVKATVAGGNITIGPDARTTSTTVAKKGSAIESKLNIVVTDGSEEDNAVIRFNTNAQEGKDDHDISKMFSLKGSHIGLYSTTESKNVAINSLPESFTGLVPVTVRMGEKGTATLSFSSVNWPAGTQASLLVNNEEIVITDHLTYTVNGELGSEVTVQVQITKKALATTTVANNSLNVFSANKSISVDLSTENAGTLSVYTLQGAQVYLTQLVESNTTTELSIPTGMYIVKVKTASQEISKQLFIQ